MGCLCNPTVCQARGYFCLSRSEGEEALGKMTGQGEPSAHPSSLSISPNVILGSTLCDSDFQSYSRDRPQLSQQGAEHRRQA